MANSVILSPNEADSSYRTVTLSGGGWQVDRPLENLIDPRMVLRARTVGLNTDDTRFDVDLGGPRGIFGVALTGGNCSLQATWRVTASRTADFASPEYQSAWMEVFPVVYDVNSIPWEDEHRFAGKRTEEERLLYPTPLTLLFNIAVIARYWRIEINDDNTANTEGYLTFSRLFVASGYIPTEDIGFGSTLVLTDESVRQTALGGADYYDIRQVRRSVVLDFPILPENEALANLFDAQFRQGIHRQVFFSWDPADQVNAARRSFVAAFEQLSEFQAVQYLPDHVGTVVRLREVL